MINSAIILAGGEGKRLRNSVPGLPKCLAPVNARPFIFYLLNHLQREGIEHFIFALGVHAEAVVTWLERHWPYPDKRYSIEDRPLGTGGAIKKAIELLKEDDVFIANGDTIFKASLAKAFALHDSSRANCTILLKPMAFPDRYGTVQMNEHLQVESFTEKRSMGFGFINAGGYFLKTSVFKQQDLPDSFSFERDWLEKQTAGLYGYAEDAYFLDIGVPSDYEKAQTESKYF